MSWTEIFNAIAPYLIPALVAAATAVLGALWNWIRTKTKNAALDKYMELANDAIITAVAETMQVFVTTIKNEGGWNDEAKAKAFEMAKIKAIEIMGAAAKQAIPQVVGDFEQWLTAKIEAATLEIKNQMPVALEACDLSEMGG